MAFCHRVVFVPLGSLFLDESLASAERRSLSTWLLGSAWSRLGNSRISKDPHSRSQRVLNIAFLQEPNLCKRDLHLHLSKLPVCLFSQLRTKASDKLREIALLKCLSPTFTGFYDTRWISDSRKQTIFIQEDAHNCRICSQGSVT